MSRIALILLTLLSGLVSVGLLTAWLTRQAPQGAAVPDLAGNLVQVTQAADPAPAHVRETGKRFVARAQGLSVPLLSALVVNNVIDPPSFTDAYWYRDFGNPARPGSGTVVVAMHSVRGGQAPGNALVELDGSGQGQIRIAVGDRLRVAGARFKVTDVAVLSKAETSRDEQIWDGQGDGLVVITCFLDPGVPVAEQPNLVVRAERIGKPRVSDAGSGASLRP